MKKAFIISLLSAVLLSCESNSKHPIIVLETQFGEIEMILHEETPLHRDNFLKMCKKGLLDSSIFHRVIPEFVAQGGEIDPSKLKKPLQKIPAEFHPTLFHKRGTVAAARQGGAINPDKLSSPSQFYLVSGRKFTKEELWEMERQANFQILAPLMGKLLKTGHYPQLQEEAKILQDAQNTVGLRDWVLDEANLLEEKFGPLKLKSFSKEQIEAYTHEGGLPELDGEYTVFGQVISGMEVIDSLTLVPTNSLSRPYTPLYFNTRVEWRSLED